MATKFIGILILCFILDLPGSFGQPVLEEYPVITETTKIREKLVNVALSQVGVRETGFNRGPQIKKYLAEVNLPEGYAYCAAGMTWCHNQLNIPNPESAWSPDWFRANVVFRRVEPRVSKFIPRQGQVAGFWSDRKNRVAHVGMIIFPHPTTYELVEFNTSGQGSFDGDGVFRTIRKKEEVYVVSDFVGWKEYLQGVKNLKK